MRTQHPGKASQLFPTLAFKKTWIASYRRFVTCDLIEGEETLYFLIDEISTSHLFIIILMHYLALFKLFWIGFPHVFIRLPTGHTGWRGCRVQLRAGDWAKKENMKSRFKLWCYWYSSRYCVVSFNSQSIMPNEHWNNMVGLINKNHQRKGLMWEEWTKGTHSVNLCPCILQEHSEDFQFCHLTLLLIIIWHFYFNDHLSLTCWRGKLPCSSCLQRYVGLEN